MSPFSRIIVVGIPLRSVNFLDINSWSGVQGQVCLSLPLLQVLNPIRKQLAAPIISAPYCIHELSWITHLLLLQLPELPAGLDSRWYFVTEASSNAVKARQQWEISQVITNLIVHALLTKHGMSSATRSYQQALETTKNNENCLNCFGIPWNSSDKLREGIPHLELKFLHGNL